MFGALVATVALAGQPSAPQTNAITWQSSRTFLTTNYSARVLVHTLQGLVNRRAFDEAAAARVRVTTVLRCRYGCNNTEGV